MHIPNLDVDRDSLVAKLLNANGREGRREGRKGRVEGMKEENEKERQM
jgi:hypothetical protein